MDERQKQVRGEIFMQVSVGSMAVMLVLAFLLDFEILKLENYMSTSDLLIGISILMLAYASCCLIVRDAYFGVIQTNQFKTCLWGFTILAVVLDGFAILDGINAQSFSFVSICSTIMINGIMISLWCKRKSW